MLSISFCCAGVSVEQFMFTFPARATIFAHEEFRAFCRIEGVFWAKQTGGKSTRKAYNFIIVLFDIYISACDNIGFRAVDCALMNGKCPFPWGLWWGGGIY